MIKIKRSSFQNLRKLKYENNEIPNSLRGSLGCVEFLGSKRKANKIPKNCEIKSYLILVLNPQYFFILGKSFYSLSHIFVIEIIDDKIIKIKWCYSQNLRKLKYENNEIPNSLLGSLNCAEFLGSSQNAIKYDMQWWSNV